MNDTSNLWSCDFWLELGLILVILVNCSLVVILILMIMMILMFNGVSASIPLTWKVGPVIREVERLVRWWPFAGEIEELSGRSITVFDNSVVVDREKLDWARIIITLVILIKFGGTIFDLTITSFLYNTATFCITGIDVFIVAIFRRYRTSSSILCIIDLIIWIEFALILQHYQWTTIMLRHLPIRDTTICWLMMMMVTRIVCIYFDGNMRITFCSDDMASRRILLIRRNLDDVIILLTFRQGRFILRLPEVNLRLLIVIVRCLISYYSLSRRMSGLHWSLWNDIATVDHVIVRMKRVIKVLRQWLMMVLRLMMICFFCAICTATALLR